MKAQTTLPCIILILTSPFDLILQIQFAFKDLFSLIPFLLRRIIQLVTFLYKRNVWKNKLKMDKTSFKVYEYLCKLFSCKTTNEKNQRSLHSFSTHSIVGGTH